MSETESTKEIKLVIKKSFRDFPTFYCDSKKVIYCGIIDLFEKIKETGNKDMKLIIITTINNRTFDTDFGFDNKILNMLTDHIIPFFEEIEDYETCMRIMSIYQYFQRY
jgi:hypothetical protein